jgi:hypothetical protein
MSRLRSALLISAVLVLVVALATVAGAANKNIRNTEVR